MAICSNLYVIAAICGNFWQESTVNPGIWENLTVNAPGFGLGQWTDNPPNVMRRTALFNWLDANNYAHDSGDGQLQFLVYENIWIPSLFVQSDYNTMTEYFQSTSTNLIALTREWMYHWEGINDGTLEVRYDAALDFLNAFQNDMGARDPWWTSNSYNTMGRATANAMRIKDFFLGGEPPVPPEPTTDELIAMANVLKKKKKIGGFVIYV